MRVEIISIGTELINGRVSDTNAQFLTREIKRIGYSLKLITRVGDDETYLEAVLSASQSRSDIVITTGGLGATNDDLTKRSLSKVINRKLVLNTEVLENIKKIYEQNQAKMPVSAQKQALMPRRCVVISNKYGTAPGFVCQENDALIISLPGVPKEMEQMWCDEVIPFLKEKYEKVDQKESLLARTCGLREIEVNDRLSGIVAQDKFSMNLIARNGGVDVEFFLTEDKYLPGNTRSSQLKKEIKKVLGSSIYTWGELNIEDVVGKLLKDKNLSISVAESCTGGLISHRLTQVAGSSAYFETGLVTYSNRSKQELSGVQSKTLEQYGAVSSNVAREMAMGVREKADTDLGLGVSGIAGPGGGSDEKPVGLVYCALASHKECFCHTFRFMGSRDAIKMKSALASLNMLRQYLEQGNMK